jgi:hypothetical protein
MIANIESAVNSIKGQVDAITFSIEQAGIALTTAQDAHDKAVAAANEAALVNSYVTPATVLTAAVDPDDDTTAIITIADHQRVYADGANTTVDVTGSSVSGLDLGVDYFITYMDAARAGGAVSYNATSDYTQAGQGNDRHLVGDITTPGATGDPPTDGGITGPPATCVTTDTLVLLANDSHDGPGGDKPAGKLQVGDWLWTDHEHTMTRGAYRVTAIDFYQRDVMHCATFPRATGEHPFFLSGAWVLMSAIGQPAGRAVIAHMEIEDAHTFIARNPDSERWVLCHNKRYNTDIP